MANMQSRIIGEIVSLFLISINVAIASSFTANDRVNVDTDAARADMKMVEANQGASIVGYLSNKSGAVVSTVAAKLAESVSVRDFGAIPDDGIDDTAPIQAALNAGVGHSVLIPAGDYIVSSVINIPGNTLLIGEGYGVGTGNRGTNLLYSGNGECLRSVGKQNVIPNVSTTIAKLRIRKTTQASPLGAIALISGSGVTVSDVRIDTNNKAWHFTYGVVLDQSEVVTLMRIDIQGAVKTGIWLVNGAEYTVGNSLNFTNVISIYDVNINGAARYGIAHDGGATFKISGGNVNSVPIGIYLGGLNNFIVENMLFEAGTGAADIYLSQYKSDLITSVGGSAGGIIRANRTSGATTNNIFIRAPASQVGNLEITANRFGYARKGAAIGVSVPTALQDSVISANINLGGASKRLLDEGIYMHNTVLSVASGAQLEKKKVQIKPGQIFSTASAGRIVSAKYVTKSYIVTDADENICVSPGTFDKVITLPPVVENAGRELTIVKKTTAAGLVIIDGNASETINGALTRVLTKAYETTSVRLNSV